MIRTTASFYFERIEIKGLENIPKEGPTILACNHPNSFLDALPITYIYRRPIYYIARGDAFKKPFGAKMLYFLNNVPIYRKEEGMENLSKNDDSFSYCLNILKEGDTILLFSEGSSENEWYLRPLRKGTARIIYEAWKNPDIGNKLNIIPVVTNYSGWYGTGTVTNIEFLKPLVPDFANTGEQGLFLKKINEKLSAVLSHKVVAVDKTKDMETQNIVTGFLIKNIPEGAQMAKSALEKLKNPRFFEKYNELAGYLKKEHLKYYDEHINIVSFIVALFIIPFAFILNIIPYSIGKWIAEKTTHRNVFYDSVFFGSLLVLGPIYMLTIGILGLLFTHSFYGFLIPLLALLTAWSYEPAKRNIYCFLQRKKLANVTLILNELFGKDND
jgi:1-acyl-sn-glycerol-3-phosphate acyltransferase